MVKPPVVILSVGTVIMFIVAIATGVSASSKRGQLFADASDVQAAADLAATSNLALVLGGVGVVGLLVTWAVIAGLRSRPVQVTGSFPEGTVWSTKS